ncbi:MAG: HD domain-containing phosphohydrolase [Candidatus Dormibacteria bacterium]
MPVAVKVIMPFLVLSLLAGAVASAVASSQIGAAAQAQVDATAIRQGDNLSAGFATFEQRQLTVLRALSGTKGVALATAARDRAALQRLLLPVLVNQRPDPLEATVVTLRSGVLIDIRTDPANVGACVCAVSGPQYGWTHVDAVLAGRSDQLGTKYAGVVSANGVTTMYTVGPILQGNTVIGAVVVGEPLQMLLAEAQAAGGPETSLILSSGVVAANTSGMPGAGVALPPSQRARVEAGLLTHGPALHTSGSELFYVPWRVRHDTVGYAAVLVPASELAGATTNLPLLLALIFVAVCLLTLLAGTAVTRQITRPLRQLMGATREVALGNLGFQARVTTSDEIGTLTHEFNSMITSLAEHRDQLRSSVESTLLTLAGALDARDSYTMGHSHRVTAYSLSMAPQLSLSDDHMRDLRRGCLVHDLGKIGIRDAVLSKPGGLTADETAMMESHTVIGHEMLAPMNWNAATLGIVRHHHERWDATGYPDRLAGEEIPRLARLVAIADTFDAMTSDRPYRRALTFEQAAAEISRGSGTQFDPQMVLVFQRGSNAMREMLLGFKTHRPVRDRLAQAS